MDRRYRDYVAALEAERRKILVFQSELPLSLQLVTQTIEACRQQMEAEETTSDPIREEERPSDWLRSVQETRDVVRKPVALNARRLGGAFHPFNKEKMVPALAPVPPVPASSSTAETTIINGGEREIEGQSQSQRKSRRCWSPELHRKFMNAIQQLGGSQAATPKQIREMMKVDRLTNDEVKSHLQKYRLHTRRPTSALHNHSSSQPTQFVVVSGMWAPPADYTAATTQISGGAKYDTPHDGIYAPVASLPNKGFTSEKNKSIRSPSSPLDPEGRCGEDVDGIVEVNAASPTSSSSQTVTASPPS